jgi:cyclopropane-fatty-acyl-phospholipid synthase
MRSKISWGEVAHWRASPKPHSFSYPIFTFELDLDELQGLAVAPRIFAQDRCALFSIRTDDYLEGGGTLRERVERVLREHGQLSRPHRITLITMPRYFGYVFNPVSFFACFDADDKAIGFVTQVNNTFGETHIYPLVCEPASLPVEWRFPKEFFVSPFYDVSGEYSVRLEREGEALSVRVDLHREGALEFSATLRGEALDATPKRVRATIWKYPVSSLLTMPRIHLQAIKIYFGAQATPEPRPCPLSRYTIHSRQTIIHRARLGLLWLLRLARRGRGGPAGAAPPEEKTYANG